MKLAGRVAIITGASQGLGAEIARHFLADGAKLMLCARSGDLLVRLQGELATKDGPSVAVEVADVIDPAQVDAVVAATLRQFGRIDALVNCAGVYGPIGLLDEIDWQEWVAAVNVNLMGTVYPCRAVIPHFRAQGYGKIINISGGGATSPLPRISAYAASKAAVVRFTETLAEEVRGCGIDVNAIAPGVLLTRMTDQLLAAGPEKVGAAFYDRIRTLKEQGGHSMNLAAALSVYLASADSDGITGKLISAVWDRWQEFETHRKDLTGSDVYTLRRILPKERGFEWE